MSAIYMLDGKPHRFCDCSYDTNVCPLGRTRPMQTAGWNQCMVPAPDCFVTTAPLAEITDFALRCRPAVKQWETRCAQSVLKWERGEYPKHYEKLLKDEAERARKLLDEIDAMTEAKP